MNLHRLISRSDDSAVGTWFWTVDRALLMLLLFLIAIGVVLILGASPPQALRIEKARHVHLGQLYFFNRQLVFATMALAAMIIVSFASKAQVRRLATLAFFPLLLAVAATLLLGQDMNGATRWIGLLGFQFQPSEFIKPCLVVVTAWLLSGRYDDPGAPVFPVSLSLVLAVVCLLVLQPDFGQSALILLVWLVQAVLAGLPLLWVGMAGAFGASALVIAFLTVPHVHNRLVAFLGDGQTSYQVTKALDAFRSGGLFGVGPAEGTVKWRLPEAHTDYIFAVAGEEYGLFACAMLVLLYLAIIWQAARQQIVEEDPFAFLAGAGLITLFGAQAFINMGVNLALLPSKGMTLPFISYGGSSMLATGIGMGMLLALTRRNRCVERKRTA